MSRLDDFVSGISEGNKYRQQISVEHRSNNSRRDFVFVNKLQGKHIPVKPSKAMEMFHELGNKVAEGIGDKRVLVIGFAETATAIGQYLANQLGEKVVYRTQTTRYINDDWNKLIDFSEEHSHATEQFLYGDISEIEGKFDYILFVEDEISTGKTILNFIEAFNKVAKSKIEFGVASICNWQTTDNREKYKELGIDTFALIEGELVDSRKKLGVEVIDYSENENIDIMIDWPGESMRERVGGFGLGDIDWLSDTIKKAILTDIELNNEDKTAGLNICVLGTEEYMYIPMVVAMQLENYGMQVKYHATTRSPIDVMIRNEGAIKNKSRFMSAYGNYETYIYNLTKYDGVYIISDGECGSLFSLGIKAAIAKYGTSYNNIKIIKIEGN